MAELAAERMAQRYDDGKTAIDPQTGRFNANLLPEHVKENIASTSAALASLAGAAGSGNALHNAQTAGVLGKTVVENNDVGASFSEWRKEEQLFKTNPQAYAKLKAEQWQAVNFLVDFIPVIGDIKGFAEAETKGDYFFAALGTVPLYGDAAQKVLQAEKAYQAAKSANDVGKMKAAIHEARKGADLPYESRQIRAELEKRYGAGNVVSTTVPPNNARNVKLAGKRHPITNIPFDNKGFPIFDHIAKFDTKIDAKKFNKASYQEQMKMMATQDLKRNIQTGKISSSAFTPAQLKAINTEILKVLKFLNQHDKIIKTGQECNWYQKTSTNRLGILAETVCKKENKHVES